jgi:hypothetical protein
MLARLNELSGPPATRGTPGVTLVNGPVGFVATLRGRAPHVLVLTFAMWATDMLQMLPLILERAPEVGALYTGCITLFGVLVRSFILVAGITAAERTGFARSHRGLALTLAVVLIAPVATVAGPSVRTTAFGSWNYFYADLAGLYLHVLWTTLLVGLLAAAYFTFWDRAQQSTTLLRIAELERQGIEHRVIESQLNVMKARVDPDFLFRSLGSIQRLYRADIDAAERRLEELIDYLRAALPRMRGGASTLGDEVHLAMAYLRLHEDTFAGRLEAAFEVNDAVREAQFPPMALLPLVDDALRRAATLEVPRLALAVRAVQEDGRLKVEVEDDCSITRTDAAGERALLAQARAFAEFFGLGASVRRGCGDGGGMRVTLEAGNAIGPRGHR